MSIRWVDSNRVLSLRDRVEAMGLVGDHRVWSDDAEVVELPVHSYEAAIEPVLCVLRAQFAAREPCAHR